MIISQFPSGGSGSIFPQFTYTGEYMIEVDSGGWKLSLLSPGTLKMKNTVDVDIFAVGGGGNGSSYHTFTRTYGSNPGETILVYEYGGGGGGGRTETQEDYQLDTNTDYIITIGNIDNSTASAFSANGVDVISAGNGDNAPYRTYQRAGGDGGSGGASGSTYVTYTNGAYYTGEKSVAGGSDGGDGGVASRGERLCGEGQGTTTREFESASGKLYGTGGSACCELTTLPEILPNTGNGGHGGRANNLGATGIVIIRNAR